MDSSDAALQAAKIAGDLVRAVQAKELQILIAQEPVPAYRDQSSLQNILNGQTDQSPELLQRAEAAVGNVPAILSSELLEGQITDTVINVAKSRRSDLIIMGSQGLARLTGALLGVNGQRIVSEAPCPVLIVK